MAISKCCFLPIVLLLHSYSYCRALQRHDLIGIWKVKIQPSSGPFFPNPAQSYQQSLARGGRSLQGQEEVTICLREDGTFCQDTGRNLDAEDPIKRGGLWDFDSGNNQLFLAANRPFQQTITYRRTFSSTTSDKDILFQGCILKQEPADDEIMDYDSIGSIFDFLDTSPKVHLAIEDRRVAAGKFLYPPKHQHFFEDPILIRASNTGAFTMRQLQGNFPQSSYSQSTTFVPTSRYQREDFYNKTFYLASSEYETVEQGTSNRGSAVAEDAPMEIRSSTVRFFKNNTFSATGYEKTLRGKFGVTADDRLWFQVSIFGAGRQAPGSVYSEGRLVDQRDKKWYLGRIKRYKDQGQSLLSVYGTFGAGTRSDFGDRSSTSQHPQRPGPATAEGTFVMQEVDIENEPELEPLDLLDDDPWGFIAKMQKKGKM